MGKFKSVELYDTFTMNHPIDKSANNGRQQCNIMQGMPIPEKGV